MKFFSRVYEMQFSGFYQLSAIRVLTGTHCPADARAMLMVPKAWRRIKPRRSLGRMHSI